MPSRKWHELISNMILGEKGSDIHKFMDEPSKWLGKNHRILRHNLPTVLILGLTKGQKAAAHAALHIATDNLITDIESRIRKEVLKLFKNIKI